MGLAINRPFFFCDETSNVDLEHIVQLKSCSCPRALELWSKAEGDDEGGAQLHLGAA